VRIFRGTQKVKLPSGELPADIPVKTKKTAKPKGLIAGRLREVIDTYALTTEECAELISAHSGAYVSRSTLGGWLRGATPRVEEKSILAALEAIEKGEGKIPKARMIEPAEVKRQIDKWRNDMTHRQIQLAGELPQSTYQAMSSGKVRIETRRWERIKSLVKMWRKIAKQSGAI